MKEFLDKISSYNLFNYLLPGVLFVVLAESFTKYSFREDDVIIAFFLYYFIGLVISRIGSLITEPLLKKTLFIKFAPYSEYIEACKKDKTIEALSELNNVYRTLSAMFFSLVILKIYETLSITYSFFLYNDLNLLVLFLLVMFLFGYRKQTKYIFNRIKCNI